MERYIVITAHTKADLYAKVAESMNKGYLLLGGVSMVREYDSTTIRYAQALILKRKDAVSL